jgi:hypothetical protein
MQEMTMMVTMMMTASLDLNQSVYRFLTGLPD